MALCLLGKNLIIIHFVARKIAKKLKIALMNVKFYC